MLNSLRVLKGIYESLRNSALCRTPQDPDQLVQLPKFVEFENLLNKSAPTSDDERTMRESVRAHYKLSPTDYAEFLHVSGHLELAIWADCGLLVRSLGLTGRIVIKWSDETNKFTVEPYSGTRLYEDRRLDTGRRFEQRDYDTRRPDERQSRDDARRGGKSRGGPPQRGPRRDAHRDERRDERRDDTRDVRRDDVRNIDVGEAAKRVDEIGDKYRPTVVRKEKPVKDRKGKKKQVEPPKITSSDSTPVAAETKKEQAEAPASN